MFNKPFMYTLRSTIAALLTGIAFAATAQFVQPQPKPPKADPLATPPAGLQWKWMDKVYFNPIEGFPDASTSEEKSLMSQTWAKEIDGLRDSDGITPMLGTALTGSVERGGTKVVLTMFKSYNSSCIQPGNGRSMYDMYSTCPLRVIRFFPDGQSTVLDLKKEFCMLDGLGDVNSPRSKNHVEYGYDDHSGIVFLRLIQYGKVVPSCNRALRIFNV